jgi:hypothetical protein
MGCGVVREAAPVILQILTQVKKMLAESLHVLSIGGLVPAARGVRGKYPAPAPARNWILLEGFHLAIVIRRCTTRSAAAWMIGCVVAPGFEMCAAEVGFADAVGEGYSFAPDRRGWSKLDQASTSA